MKVITLPLGAIETNTYVIYDDEKNAVIIDPADCADEIEKTIANYGIEPLKIILTHGHFDHILAAEELAQNYGIQVYVHSSDLELLNDTKKNLFDDFEMNGIFRKVTDIKSFEDGDTINAGSMSFKIMSTPGHTNGSCCLICDDCIFTGDTLFSGSIGRTDMPGGDYGKMKASLEKFKIMNGDFKIYPGHGEASILSRELVSNIYLADFDQI